MSTHNIGFYEDLTKIIFELSSNIIKYAPYFFCCVVRNRLFAYAKTKTQISFVVTVKLISAFVFAIGIVLSLYFLNLKFQDPRNFKPLAIFCNCTVWFVSDLVGNPEDWFSHNEAQIIT